MIVSFPAEMDQVSPALMANAVWTWAEGQPANPTDPTLDCTVLNTTSIRWYTTTCSSSLNAACCLSNPSSSGQPLWSLTVTSTSWAAVACPSGYSFSPPQTGFEISQLMDLLRADPPSLSQVWL